MKKFFVQGLSFLKGVWQKLSLSPREVIYIAAMYLLLLVACYFMKALYGFSLSYSKIWPGIECIKTTALFLLLLLPGHFLCRRSSWYLWSILLIHFLVLFILTGIYVTTGTFFCESILYLVYDTSWAETKDFIAAYINIKQLLLLVGILAVYFTGMHFLRKIYRREKKYCHGDLYAGLFLFVLAGILMGWETRAKIARSDLKAAWNSVVDDHPFCSICDQIKMFHRHAGMFTYEMRHRKTPDFIEKVPATDEPAVIGAFVIGESAIRSHHSIYGYARQTTPCLDAERANIVAFDNAITVLPVTITALKYWLTDMTLNNRHVSWTLFDALKAGGYRVEVITNQNKSGWADSPLQMMFSCADSITYMHEENFSDLPEDANARIYDENLLPYFHQRIGRQQEEILQPYVLCVHLFGSHDPFASRYPENFYRDFLNDDSSPARVNEYDTSVRYSDFILGQFMQELNTLDRPAFLIYISDHGSVCESGNLRTPTSQNTSAYEIPFLFWSNRQFQERYPEVIARAKKAQHIPLQCDHAIYGLLEMMGVPLQKKVEKFNFLSPEFIPGPRFLNEGREPYSQE